MKEYLVKDPQTGEYWVSNSKEYGFVCEVPDGAEFYVESKLTGDCFFGRNNKETIDTFDTILKNEWHKESSLCFEAIEVNYRFLWRRGTLVEYLNPADWSLHVVDVDNDAEGEDWIKVPDGAEQLTKCGLEFVFWKDKGNFSWHTKNSNEWDDNIKHQLTTLNMYGMEYIVWQRYSQPEELPFVDDGVMQSYLSHSLLVGDEPKGQKHDSAKPRMSLLPKGVLSSVVSVLEFGAKKYQEENWKQVSNAKTRYYDAMQRHIGAWWEGEKNDPETGEHHLAHAICCAMFLIWFDKEQSQ